MSDPPERARSRCAGVGYGIIRSSPKPIPASPMHSLHTGGVTGSIPVAPTIFPNKIKLSPFASVLILRTDRNLSEAIRIFGGGCKHSGPLKAETGVRFPVEHQSFQHISAR